METELDEKKGKGKNRGLWTLRILLNIYALLYIIIGWATFYLLFHGVLSILH
jgi:hypothetical protein